MLREGCARRNSCFVYLLSRPLKLEKAKRDSFVLLLGPTVVESQWFSQPCRKKKNKEKCKSHFPSLFS